MFIKDMIKMYINTKTERHLDLKQVYFERVNEHEGLTTLKQFLNHPYNEYKVTYYNDMLLIDRFEDRPEGLITHGLAIKATERQYELIYNILNAMIDYY